MATLSFLWLFHVKQALAHVLNIQRHAGSTRRWKRFFRPVLRQIAGCSALPGFIVARRGFG
jgi:hypothetical protein